MLNLRQSVRVFCTKRTERMKNVQGTTGRGFSGTRLRAKKRQLGSIVSDYSTQLL